MPIRRQLTDPRGFSRRVQELRLKKQHTLAELGAVVGVSGTCVWNWEAGNTYPRAASLQSLARALGTTPEYLAEGDKTEAGAGSPVGSVPMAKGLGLKDRIELSREWIAEAAQVSVENVRVVVDYGS